MYVSREEPGIVGQFVEMELPGIVWVGQLCSPFCWFWDEVPGQGLLAAMGMAISAAPLNEWFPTEQLLMVLDSCSLL